MDLNPYESPRVAGERREPEKAPFSVARLVVLALFGAVIALGILQLWFCSGLEYSCLELRFTADWPTAAWLVLLDMGQPPVAD
jgi:hypothetical protein